MANYKKELSELYAWLIQIIQLEIYDHCRTVQEVFWMGPCVRILEMDMNLYLAMLYDHHINDTKYDNVKTR